MNLIPVDEIPCRKAKHDLRGFIRGFVDSDVTSAEVEFTNEDYISPLVCYKCLYNAVKFMGYNAIVAVVKRGDEVYLVRKVNMNK